MGEDFNVIPILTSYFHHEYFILCRSKGRSQERVTKVNVKESKMQGNYKKLHDDQPEYAESDDSWRINSHDDRALLPWGHVGFSESDSQESG